MKKVLMLMTALVLPLGACNSASQTEFITNVQKATVAACSFLPAAESIAAIFSANSTLFPSQVANAICAAVLKPGIGKDDGTKQAAVMVGNKSIPVHGMFVSKE